MRDVPEIEAELDDWYQASRSGAAGSSYSIGGRSLTKADLNQINDQINILIREQRAYLRKSQAVTPVWN